MASVLSCISGLQFQKELFEQAAEARQGRRKALRSLSADAQ